MTQKIQSVRGMNDITPAHSGAWRRVESALGGVAQLYGYQEIRTPVLERAELFTTAIGGATDIVEKEMYAFTDAGGEQLALRPEATAATVRACNQHGLLHNRQQRLWYLGPMFRRERPQKGRYRQFHQFGVEAFGWQGPDIDAEVIRVGARIFSQLNISGVELQLNTLGSPAVAAAYREALQKYFSQHENKIDEHSRRRLKTNPLRILDSKDDATIKVAAGAPAMLSFLDDAARAHFDGVCESLTAAGVAFAVNPKLVRGLDYYTGVVFEWLGGFGAQNAVCAGGRYDELVAQHGGAPTPAVGFALGVERLVELAGDGSGDDGVTVYVVVADAAAAAVTVAEQLRDGGVTVTMHCGGGALKKQMRRADQSGAQAAVIVGDAADTVQAKNLTTGEQQTVAADSLINWCRENLNHG